LDARARVQPNPKDLSERSFGDRAYEEDGENAGGDECRALEMKALFLDTLRLAMGLEGDDMGSKLSDADCAGKTSRGDLADGAEEGCV
jgi:hypothetical protein